MAEIHANGSAARSEVTRLLAEWQNGERSARDRLIVLVYDDLRRAAARQLGAGHALSLRPTALVHETYLKLIDAQAAPWQSRAHFMAVAARAMRQIAIDHARRKAAVKRDGGLRVTLRDGLLAQPEPEVDLLDLNDALERLAELYPDKARIVEMHYFGGMSSEEIAEVINCAPITVKRGWRTARAWLHRQLASA